MNILKSIWEEHLTGREKYYKSRLDIAGPFVVYAATNQITGKRLFILEIEKATSSQLLKNIQFRGLVIQILEFETHKELTILLLDNSLEDIFISFIENILEEITSSVNDDEALARISAIIARWKKLFDKAATAGLTPEQQKGMLGELLLFSSLLSESYPARKILEAWAGPMHADKDFLFGAVGIEVKLTSSKYPSIKITNERQLENLTLETLYLFLFIVEEVKQNGITLPGLISDISDKIRADAEALKTFETRLAQAGYNGDEEDYYGQQYFVKAINKYDVNENFPRLITSDLEPGIYNVSYSIELSACEGQKVLSETITELLNGY
ncbi:MAG: PD-(D/E)XK motif protein [Bacteroidota bacterium]